MASFSEHFLLNFICIRVIKAPGRGNEYNQIIIQISTFLSYYGTPCLPNKKKKINKKKLMKITRY